MGSRAWRATCAASTSRCTHRGTREALAPTASGSGVSADRRAALVGGQVKTFHPAVYAGILARRDVPAPDSPAARGIGRIGIEILNVEPVARAFGSRLVRIDEAIEMIDVGGAALLGAAARNSAGVAAVASPRHYPQLVSELREFGGVSAEFRQQLAADAFGAVAAYFAEIAAYLNQVSARSSRPASPWSSEVDDLRYGRTHQREAFCRETTHRVARSPTRQVRAARLPSTTSSTSTRLLATRDFTGPPVIAKHRPGQDRLP
jgi:phosphoribosylaminoimidazolecarboxamide formyltransferase/IMP cyclohydrolase